MEITVIHVLTLTPYEASLPVQSFEELLEQDYPMHSLEFPKTKGKMNLGNPCEDNPFAAIDTIQQFAAAAGLVLHWEQRVDTI